MVDKHNRVFSGRSTDLNFLDKIRHKLKLNADAEPFRRANGNTNFEKRKTVKRIAEDLKKSDLVEPNHSNWAAPSILVKKKDVSHRLVVGYRRLSNEIEKTSWPLPRISNIIDTMDCNMIFSIIDLTSGYFQNNVR